MSAVKSFLWALGAAVVARYRWWKLKLWRLAGSTQRRLTRGRMPFVAAAVGLAVGLFLLDELGGRLYDALSKHDFFERFPDADGVFTFGNFLIVCGLASALMVLRWLARARERVVIDDFIDYTTSDAKAVGGLATLLATELSRLRSLYASVNETLSVPVAVGVEAQAPGGPPTQAGAFLAVRADDVSETLKAVVASEAKLTLGPFLIPIGNLMAVLGRLVRGPRVLGSVHRTEAGGGPTVAAQIVGRPPAWTWRVDGGHQIARSEEERKAFLDDMIAELAYRIFTDLTLQGSVRWRAIRSFTQYLQRYWASLRTPKNRGLFLKEAEEQLLDAVSEDESFDYAYYNLGVIYSQLSQTELSSTRQADAAPEGFDPLSLHRSRMQAATVAFRQTIERNRNRWEAYYGLAIHRLTGVKSSNLERGHGMSRQEQVEALREVLRMCERVVEIQPRNAQAHDLKGLAQLDLLDEEEYENYEAAIASHRKAVRLSWGKLCSEERQARVRPPTTYTALPKVQENATASLHHLAHAYATKARHSEGLKRWLNFRRAETLFDLACKLTPVASTAASDHERGRLMEDRGKHAAAVERYEHATSVEPENPLYWAELGRARARGGHPTRAREACDQALAALAPVWRRALSPQHTPGAGHLTCETFDALRDAYKALESEDDLQRLREMRRLGVRLARLASKSDLPAVQTDAKASYRSSNRLLRAGPCGRRSSSASPSVARTSTRARPTWRRAYSCALSPWLTRSGRRPFSSTSSRRAMPPQAGQAQALGSAPGGEQGSAARPLEPPRPARGG
jgi:tetratricopeptide (TPR) repeat protein